VSSTLKRTAIIAIVIVVVLAAVFIVAMLDERPQYRFVGGHVPTQRFVQSTDYNKIYCDYYSFPADFNALYQQASVELASLGFREDRTARLPNYLCCFTREGSHVQIVNGERLGKQSSFQTIALESAPGRILVAVYYNKPKVTFWRRIRQLGRRMSRFRWF